MQVAEINDHLFLSSARAVRRNRILSLGITCIINCTADVPALQLPGTECIRFKVDDIPTARLSAFFDKCADKVHDMHEKGGKTLIHCYAGVSRSATLCIAYLMKYSGMSLVEAYCHVKKCRPVIHPNNGFFRQLIEYEHKIFGKNTVRLVGAMPDVYREELRYSSFKPR